MVNRKFFLSLALLAIIIFSLSFASALACGSTITTNTVLDSDMTCSGGALIIGADNIILDCAGHSITGTNTGNSIYLSSRIGVTVKNCVITNFSGGIFLRSSNNNILSNNNLLFNTFGFYSSSSSNNLFTDNIVDSNLYGFSVAMGSNNTFSNNQIGFNSASGLYLEPSSNNTVTNNTIHHNSRGVDIRASSNNLVYNNFFNNTNNVYTDSNTNLWSIAKTSETNIIGGLFVGGNFWANPTGNGFSQTCVDQNNDGFCDFVYIIGTNSIDYLPLKAVIVVPCIDVDGDSYGLTGGIGCGYPEIDCNDNNAAIHPGAIETCNGVDDNCDGQIDEGVKITFYLDSDGDGFGNAAITAQFCALPVGYSSNSLDCNDNNAAINPGATETCNSIDDNCNGIVDDTPDSDGDGIKDCLDQCPSISVSDWGIEGTGCPAGVKVMLQEKIADRGSIGGLCPPGQKTCTEPIVAGERYVTSIAGKLYDEAALLSLLGTRSVPLDRLCSIYKDSYYNSAMATKEITEGYGELMFGLSSVGGNYIFLGRDTETILGQNYEICTLEKVESRSFSPNYLGYLFTLVESNVLVVTTSDSKGVKSVKKTAGHTSQITTLSVLDVTYPQYNEWTSSSELYPIFLSSDSDMEADVCLEGPEGYVIAGVLDDEGNLVPDLECVQTMVAGQPKAIVFKAIDVGSPAPDFKMKLTAKHNGKSANLEMAIPGKRKGIDKPTELKKEAKKTAKKGSAGFAIFLEESLRNNSITTVLGILAIGFLLGFTIGKSKSQKSHKNKKHRK